MPMICEECPNKTEFLKDENGWCKYRTKDRYNEHGEWEDSGDTSDYDDFQSDDFNWECENCGSICVEDVSEDEWEAWNGPKVTPEQIDWRDIIGRKNGKTKTRR